jgi:flagellar biogenesis protein FliO
MCDRKQFASLIVSALIVVALLDRRSAIAEESPYIPPAAGQIMQPASNNRGAQQATHTAPLINQQRQPSQTTPSLKLSPLSEAGKSTTRSGPFGAIVTVVGSLAVVLGLFFGLAWLMRRGLPSIASRLPKGVVEVLGSSPLAARRQMHVLRFGDKLLLVCVSQNGVDTLSEIEDTAEVERLTAMCQDSQSGAGSFNQIFHKRSRSTAAEHAATSGGLAAMAHRKKAAAAGEAAL